MFVACKSDYAEVTVCDIFPIILRKYVIMWNICTNFLVCMPNQFDWFIVFQVWDNKEQFNDFMLKSMQHETDF
jgi:hypothetical protein